MKRQRLLSKLYQSPVRNAELQLKGLAVACIWFVHAPVAHWNGVGFAKPNGRVIAWANIGSDENERKRTHKWFFEFTA